MHLCAQLVHLLLHLLLFRVLELFQLLFLGSALGLQLILALGLGAAELGGAFALRALHGRLHRLLQLAL